jgi:hypothetical protein
MTSLVAETAQWSGQEAFALRIARRSSDAVELRDRLTASKRAGDLSFSMAKIIWLQMSDWVEKKSVSKREYKIHSQ